MKTKQFISGLLIAALSFLNLQPLALAAEVSIPGSSGTTTTSGDTSANPNIRISPDAFKSLSPEQQQLIQQRMKSGEGPASSPETKAISPGETSSQKATQPQYVPPAAPEEISDYEQAIAGQVQGMNTRMRQYGYSLFAGTQSTFAPVDDLPVPDDYVMAPGDEIIISTVSPRRNGDYSLIVNRNGSIFYPNFGAIQVSGMTFSKMTNFLTQKIKGGAPDMRLSIRMGKLRTLKVFLIGQVHKPGSYTISSLSSLSNALMACGGPTKMGTLRDVQLKRSGKVVTHFDLYDFLMRGDSSKDVRLQSGDIIFVPEIGPLVGVAGNVKQPAIYELKGKTTLLAALKLAGNVTPMGYTQQLQIERFYKNEAKITLDIDLNSLKSKDNLTLQDGDLIKIFNIPAKLLNTVYLEGNVLRPGKYEYRKNLRLRDVIHDESELNPESYMDFALIERVTHPDSHIELIPFNLGQALAGDTNQNKPLQPGDTIRIFYRWAIQDQPKVRVSGEVHRGGEFQLRPNMAVSELIHLAGGLKDEADVYTAELTRVQVVNNKIQSNRLTLNLQKILQGDKAANIPLMKDDYILIKAVPEYKLYRTATLAGEFAQPGTYTYQDGETLSDLIKRAGGFTKRAYLKGSVFTRLSVKRQQEERMEEFSRKLEENIYRSSAQGISSALSPDDAKANQEAVVSQKALLATVRQAKAPGRMIVDLDQLKKGPKTEADVQLEEGDTLIVPPLLNSVSVLGQVYNPTAITYKAGKNVDFYLAKTGNPTDNADVDGMYVIRADGSVLTKSNFETGWGFWKSGLRSANLEPGDSIIVPEKLASVSGLRDIRDITQILFQIATTAAVTWGILKK